MQDRINKVVPGTGIRASWGNDIVDQIRRLHLIPGNGIKISTTSKGTRIELDLPQESSSRVNAISDVIPCIINETPEGEETGAMAGFNVTLYPNGFLDGTTETGTLYVPEVTTHTKLPKGTSILAHVCLATYMQSDENGDDLGE